MIKGLHLEVTNKCTLKCPRCSRTEFIEQFPKAWANKDLDLEAFKKFFDMDNLTISLNGTYGDPIYYPKLFDLIKFLKSKNCSIWMSTNGSYHNQDWWRELGGLLDSKDTISFAIDGLPENFTTYRVNGDWSSIEAGIHALRSYPVKLAWQYILFSYNEHCVDQAEQLSRDLGFEEFNVIPSSRFDHEQDPLIPSQGRGNISNSKIVWKTNKDVEIEPKCKKTNNDHYISADGYYTPCCWSSEHRFFYKSEFWKNKDIYDIKKTTLSKLLSNEKTVNFYSNLETTKPEYCTFSCPKG
jgi:MoaA/NifB/PqqE/SkfB family radical SAM enzyme